jgi:hypothetical protein
MREDGKLAGYNESELNDRDGSGGIALAISTGATFADKALADTIIQQAKTQEGTYGTMFRQVFTMLRIAVVCVYHSPFVDCDVAVCAHRVRSISVYAR